MQYSSEFNVDQKLSEWEQSLLSSPIITPSDCEDLKSHLLDLYDEYLSLGNTKENAFLLALNKIGGKTDWEQEFENVNNYILQVKKTVTILFGVLFYFFSYFLIVNIDNYLLILGAKTGFKADQLTHFNWSFLSFCCLLVLFFFTNIIIKEKYFMRLLQKNNFKPKHSIYLLLATFILAFLDRYSNTIFSSLDRQGLIEYQVVRPFQYFSYIFPLLISSGFVVIYYRYYKIYKNPFKN